METPVKSDCTVLIPSCDAYSDLWAPFFALFHRYWPDCPYRVVLGSNQQIYDDPRVETLPSTEGMNWSNRVRDYLQKIDSTYVLMILEDFFLRRPVQTSEVAGRLQDLGALKGHMMRLHAQPGPETAAEGHRTFGSIPPGTAYRVSTQAAIWRRETLLSLLQPNESIWEFEILGTERSSSWSDGFYSVWKSLLPYEHHVVERGKWLRPQARILAGMDVGCDFSRRPVMSRVEYALYSAHVMGWLLVRHLPFLRSSPLMTSLRHLKNTPRPKAPRT